MSWHGNSDPDHAAYLEAAGWHAYYDRRWGQLLRLLLHACRDEFGIPFPHYLLAAYYLVCAARAWAPAEHDAQKVRGYYQKFYRLARRYGPLTFDPVQVAALELQYNDDHRRLVLEEDKTPLLQTLASLHTALFGLSADVALESARWRVQALTICDQITLGRSQNERSDWKRVYRCLRECYRAVNRTERLQRV